MKTPEIFGAFGTKGNVFFPVLTGQGNNFGMPPEYNYKLRQLLLSVRSMRHGKSTVNPYVHEMYDLSMGCNHLGNVLLAFLPVVSGTETEYKQRTIIKEVLFVHIL